MQELEDGRLHQNIGVHYVLILLLYSLVDNVENLHVYISLSL